MCSPGLVSEVVGRNSELADPPIANVDQVLLVFAASDPPVRCRPWLHIYGYRLAGRSLSNGWLTPLPLPQFDVTQVTRFLVATEVARIPITVVLNKCDLLPAAEVDR